MKKTRWLSGLLILLLAGAGGAWWWNQAGKASVVQYKTGKIERGPLQATVSASGAVNPVTQVSVGTQISGQIRDLLVDFNSEVKRGQLLALIDPETFEYRVRQSQADVDAARAAVLTAQANVAASNAQVSRAKVDLTEAQRDLDRKLTLVDKQFIAQSEADRARALVNTTTEGVKAAEAQVAVTSAQVKSAQANVAQREAALAQARVDLQRTRITSPVDGIVIKRSIDKGQTVAASLQAPELFVIAQNLRDMQVDASIDESDVGRIRNGQRASFTVDAFPGQTFEGQVSLVRKAAQNIANVVTYIAVVSFTNSEGRLLPGMTANVRVVTDSRESVLKVPNAALRVRLAGIEPAAPASAAQGSRGPSSAPASGASGTITGDASSAPRSWSFMSLAWAQPAGGGFAGLRERLVADLQLSADQQGKLDAIITELRPGFMALRDLPEADRPAQREKLSAQMRQKIESILNPVQRVKYGEMVAAARSQQAGGASPGQTARAAASAPGGQGASASSNISPAPRSSAALAAKPGALSPSPPAAGAGAGSQSGTVATPGVPGATGGGPLMEFRNRLITELQLTSNQLGKVDTVFADARTRYQGLRDVAAEERPKARDRITAELRARVGDLLNAEQKLKYATMLAEAASRTSSRGRIYLLDAEGKAVAYSVRLGISDGSSTELLVAPGSPQAALLVEGATVVTGTVTPPAGSQSRGPRLTF